jgi:hypothetical protein
MKKKNTLSIVMTFAIMIFAIVAVCVLFAPAFTDTVRGTGWHVIFKNNTNNGDYMIPELIGAFVLSALTFVLGFLLFFVKGKGRTALYIFIAAIGLIAGLLFCFGKQFFILHSPSKLYNDFAIGGAFITAAIFDFLTAIVASIGVYLIHKNTTVDDED